MSSSNKALGVIYGAIIELLGKGIEAILVILRRSERKLDDLARNQLALQQRVSDGFAAQADELAAQRVLLEKILAAGSLSPAVRFVLTWRNAEGEIIEGEPKLKNHEQVTASITPIDADNQPTTVDGIPVWASSDETIATVTPAADGMSATVKAVGPLGTADISVTGDADLGAGIKPIFGKGTVSVIAGEAVGFSMKFSDPVPQT